jgi:hypothetical protein
MVEVGKGMSVRVFALFIVVIAVLADQFQEDCGEQHEHEGLDEAYEQLEEVERNGRQPRQPLAAHEHHVLQDILTRENVSIQTE